MQTIGSPGLWFGFIAFVLAMLALDLGVFHRKAHAPSTREALSWSLVWIALAGVFAGIIYFSFGSQRALEFVTGYVVEKALSVDNLFVFVVLFGAFKVPVAAQHRVLFWGVLGALVLRGLFIAAGGALVAKFSWLMYGFGAFLVFTAVKLWLHRHETEQEDEAKPGRGRLFRVLQRFLPTTEELDGARFFTRKNGKWLATPLLLVLFLVEGTDVIFAVDSVPAVFGITRDPFIVFTSNVMAILGLRSLYFVLADFVTRFYYLKHALAIVLGFVGLELLLIDVYHLPIAASLGFIVVTLGVAVLASWRRERRLAREAEAQAAPRGASADKSSSISSMLKGFSN